MKTYISEQGWVTEDDSGRIFEATDEEIEITLREWGYTADEIDEEFEELYGE